MPISDYDYQEACYRLDYISASGRMLKAFLACLCAMNRCPFCVDAASFDDAEQRLGEVVDDLFGNEKMVSGDIKERWEWQDSHGAEDECWSD